MGLLVFNLILLHHKYHSVLVDFSIMNLPCVTAFIRNGKWSWEERTLWPRQNLGMYLCMIRWIQSTHCVYTDWILKMLMMLLRCVLYYVLKQAHYNYHQWVQFLCHMRPLSYIICMRYMMYQQQFLEARTGEKTLTDDIYLIFCLV